MAKRDIPGVIRAEAGAAPRDRGRIACAPGQSENVACDYVFVGVVRAHPVGRMNSFVVKTFEIDRIRTIDGEFSSIDITGDRIDQTEILVLIITAERSGKQDQRETTAVSKGKHFKLAAKMRRIPFKMAFVHFGRDGS